MTWVSTGLKQMLNRQGLGVTGLLTMELAPSWWVTEDAIFSALRKLGRKQMMLRMKKCYDAEIVACDVELINGISGWWV